LLNKSTQDTVLSASNFDAVGLIPDFCVSYCRFVQKVFNALSLAQICPDEYLPPAQI